MLIKKRNKAFTFIEVIVVVTIFTIVSTSGMFYFSKFTEGRELKRDIFFLEENISELTNSITNYSLLDYRLTLEKGSVGYSYIINTYSTETPSVFDFDFISGNVNVTPNASLTGAFLKLKTFSDIKFLEEKIIDPSESFSENYLGYSEIRIEQEGEFQNLETLWAKYLASDSTNIQTSVLEINTLKNKGGTNFDSVMIENKRGKKNIIGNPGSISLDEIFIFFEKAGAETLLKLNTD